MLRLIALFILLQTSVLYADPNIPSSILKDESTYIWPGTSVTGWVDSYVKLHEPTDPAAVATVTFYNTYTHQGDEIFTLTWDNITISVEIEWNVDDIGSERIIVTPPNGYIAVPPELDVPEEAYGEIQIYKFFGM
jgi:hypothetical protein